MVDESTSIIVTFIMAAVEVSAVPRPETAVRSVLVSWRVEAVNKEHILGPTRRVNARAIQATACRSKLINRQSSIQTLHGVQAILGEGGGKPF